MPVPSVVLAMYPCTLLCPNGSNKCIESQSLSPSLNSTVELEGLHFSFMLSTKEKKKKKQHSAELSGE